MVEPKVIMKSEKDSKSSELIIKGPKGEFDVSSPEGRKQVEEVLYSLAQAQGKAAQEMDLMKRSQSRKYDLSGIDGVDLKDAKNVAKKMREEGASEDDLDNFWAEYSVQTAKKAAKSNEFDVMWAEYSAYRPELFNNLSKLDQDLYKKHVHDSYKDRLQGEDNQFQFLDQVFEDKIRRAQEISNPQVDDLPDPAPYVEGGSHMSRPSRQMRSSQEETQEDRASVLETYRKLGFEIK